MQIKFCSQRKCSRYLPFRVWASDEILNHVTRQVIMWLSNEYHVTKNHQNSDRQKCKSFVGLCKRSFYVILSVSTIQKVHDILKLMRFSLNGCSPHWLEPYWNWWPWVKGQRHGDVNPIFLHNSLLNSLLCFLALLCSMKMKFGMSLRYTLGRFMLKFH